MTILSGRKIRKVYGKKSTAQEVLKGIDMEVEEGEFVGIMGPSGSGKTTFLNVLCSIDKVSEGVIEISGQKLRDEGKGVIQFPSRAIGIYLSRLQSVRYINGKRKYSIAAIY